MVSKPRAREDKGWDGVWGYLFHVSLRNLNSPFVSGFFVRAPDQENMIGPS